MLVHFTKMHGLGNDFVVIDAIHQEVSLDADQVRYLADRHLGIGCDQVLLILPASSDKADFGYRIYNADGGEVEQCGNGARCFARFVRDKGLVDKTSICVETISGLIELAFREDGMVSVDMGLPRFDPADVPFEASEPALLNELDAGGKPYKIAIVSMGNPHAVLMVKDIDKAPVETLGPLIESHPRFPERVNVGFMQVLDNTHIRLRVHERGAGETRACGTGACAAVVSGQRLGLLANDVDVSLQGGDLVISWGGGDNTVHMTGPATSVFEGRIEI